MVTIELGDDVALVLFEFLSREIEDRRAVRIPSVIDHPAEFWSLNDVEGALQRILVDPFKPDYHELVAAARRRIIETCDPDGNFVPNGWRI
jgi:hypothetical protein